MPAGRPSTYTDELAAEICARLMDGESMRGICKSEEMPGLRTVFRWLQEKPEFWHRYAKAREVQAELLADEIVEISDDGSNDWMERNHGEDAAWVTNGEAVARSRLRVDARKWVASKLLPNRYGDRVTHQGDTDKPIVHQITMTIVDAAED